MAYFSKSHSYTQFQYCVLNEFLIVACFQLFLLSYYFRTLLNTSVTLSLHLCYVQIVVIADGMKLGIIISDDF